MPKKINIGAQDFKEIISYNTFFVDKTLFIKEWWENRDTATLIARPRRFGKTLNMSMVDYFFSNKHADDALLFDGLEISKDAELMALQGTYPVISMTFSDIKENNFESVMNKLRIAVSRLYGTHRKLLEEDCLSKAEKMQFEELCEMRSNPELLKSSLQLLSDFLYRYYGKKVIILLDEYDTPLQEAYVYGYWDEMTGFVRGMFNSTFKANTSMERALLTGITRVSKESIFSDLNNLEVVTISSEKYADSFGFTQEEVDQALISFGLESQSEKVEQWYDGFIFGESTVIYNPWSVINYLDKKEFKPYWANTSSNSLISRLVLQGDRDIKQKFMDLLQGESICAKVDEQVVYDQLDYNKQAVWSLMTATGYLKILDYDIKSNYTLELTNYEVRLMFETMISGWFDTSENYNDFIYALLHDDTESMNEYMNRIALNMISYFDSGKEASEKGEPERFYHGLVLGLMVDLEDKYTIQSNRESGFGRYDVMLEPKTEMLDGIIMEFKVFNPKKEKTLEDTAQSALEQIEEMQYEAVLRAKGVKNIRKYGFCFEGKEVLIVQAQ